MYESELMSKVKEGKEYKQKYWKNLFSGIIIIFILRQSEEVYI